MINEDSKDLKTFKKTIKSLRGVLDSFEYEAETVMSGQPATSGEFIDEMEEKIEAYTKKLYDLIDRADKQAYRLF